MEKAIELFMQWERMSAEERTFFAGLVEGYNRAPKEAAPAAAAKPRKPRKTRTAAQAAAAAAGA